MRCAEVFCRPVARGRVSVLGRLGEWTRRLRIRSFCCSRSWYSPGQRHARVAASLDGNAQRLQGAAPGNQLIEHLIHRFLVVRSGLELGVILEVREARKGS